MKNKLYKIGLSALSILLLGFIIVGACKKSSNPTPDPPAPNPGNGTKYELYVRVYNNMTDAQITDAVVKVTDPQGKTHDLTMNKQKEYEFTTDKAGDYKLAVQGSTYVKMEQNILLKNDACPDCGAIYTQDMYMTIKTPPVTMGDEGGVVADQFDKIDLVIPAGMLTEPVQFSITDVYQETLNTDYTLKSRANEYMVKSLIIDITPELSGIPELTLSYKLAELEITLEDWNGMLMLYNNNIYNGVYNETTAAVDFIITMPATFSLIEAAIMKVPKDDYLFYPRCNSYLKNQGIIGNDCKVDLTLVPYEFNCPPVDNDCRPLSFKGVTAEVKGVPGDNFTGRVTSYVPYNRISRLTLDPGKNLVEDFINVNIPEVIMEFEEGHSGGGGN